MTIENNNDNHIIDELFGIWKDEDQLGSDTIINKTISNRELNVN